MNFTNHQIIPLDPDIQTRVTSSIQIVSLRHVVIGLLENSIDAGATEISIKLDFKRGFCSVEDNGCGIATRELVDDSQLAKQFCTIWWQYMNMQLMTYRYLKDICFSQLWSLRSVPGFNSQHRSLDDHDNLQHE